MASSPGPPTIWIGVLHLSLPKNVDRAECIELVREEYAQRLRDDGAYSAQKWMAAITVTAFYSAYKAEILFGVGSIITVLAAL